jgi:hypothetical protein
MQFECSDEEIVRIVRRREGYSLFKSYWKNPLSKGIIIIAFSFMTTSLILSEIPSISHWWTLGFGGLSLITWFYLAKRLWGTCKYDAKLAIDYIISKAKEG